MKTSEKGRNLIKQFEGCRHVVYLDQGGLPTVGYGHMDLSLMVGQLYSSEQIGNLFDRDILRNEEYINKYVSVPLVQHQFDPLVSFVFNIGIGQFLGSTLLSLLNQGHYDEVPEQLLRWSHVKGKISDGLRDRREIEGLMFAGLLTYE